MRAGAFVFLALCAAGCSQAFRFSDGAPDAGDAGGGDGGFADAGVDAGSDGGGFDGGPCGLPGACECEADQGCTAARPRCAADHRCVECLANADCGADGGLCDTKTRRCTWSCTLSNECTADSRNHCEDGHCVACETFFECSVATPVCAVSVGYCVVCNADTSCAAPTPRCDRRSGTCVACLTTADCAATEYCQPASGACAPRP